MAIEKRVFGQTAQGQPVHLYTLTNASGMQAGILTYGGILAFLRVPDRVGKTMDIVLGYDTVAEYEKNDGYLGALIGRCANRIHRGEFLFQGNHYALHRNSNGHHLHGGEIGFDKKVWDAEIRDDCLILSITSPDGDEGYPGSLSVSVTHSLSDDGVFAWEYTAHSDRDTLCNLTNHTYFNLAGHGSGTILEQELQVEADFFTETNEELIPTGKMLAVEGTPMDFRQMQSIGACINAEYQPLRFAGGYDHNYAVRGQTGVLRQAASGFCPANGIAFCLRTTSPGIQLYTGNFLSSVKGKEQAQYDKNSGFCLETQYFPDAVNHKGFEQPLLKAGDTWHHVTSIALSAK